MTPTSRVRVMGMRGSVALTAIIDTGFDGHVCLPIIAAAGLGLELVGETRVELADGTAKRELRFAATVEFLGEQRSVDVFLTQSEDALIGTKLLADCRLVIDFPTGDVRVTRKRPRRTRSE